jgi:hypothetical protein
MKYLLIIVAQLLAVSSYAGCSEEISSVYSTARKNFDSAFANKLTFKTEAKKVQNTVLESTLKILVINKEYFKNHQYDSDCFYAARTSILKALRLLNYIQLTTKERLYFDLNESIMPGGFALTNSDEYLSAIIANITPLGHFSHAAMIKGDALLSYGEKFGFFFGDIPENRQSYMLFQFDGDSQTGNKALQVVLKNPRPYDSTLSKGYDKLFCSESIQFGFDGLLTLPVVKNTIANDRQNTMKLGNYGLNEDSLLPNDLITDPRFTLSTFVSYPLESFFIKNEVSNWLYERIESLGLADKYKDKILLGNFGFKTSLYFLLKKICDEIKSINKERKKSNRKSNHEISYPMTSEEIHSYLEKYNDVKVFTKYFQEKVQD